MRFAISSEKERFLKLALKVISGTASRDEQVALDGLFTAQPALRDRFSQLKREWKVDRECEFTELFLRVLFNTASSGEVARVRSLQKSHSEAWVEFESMALVLQILGEGAQVPEQTGDAPEAMPEQVRSDLITKLEKTPKMGQSHRK